MRRGSNLLIVFALLAATSVFAQEPTIIRNVTLIDGTGKVEKNVDVKTNHQKIEDVGPHLQGDESYKVVDGTGKFLIPGLVDARVQLNASPANKINRAELGNEQRIAWLHSMLRMGITTTRLIQGDLVEHTGFKHWRDVDRLNSPTIVVSGPTFTIENGAPSNEYGITAFLTRQREVVELKEVKAEDDPDHKAHALADMALDRARLVIHNGGQVVEVHLSTGPDPSLPLLTDEAVVAITREAHGHDLHAFCWVGHNDEALRAIKDGCDVLEGMTEETFSDDVLKQMVAKNVGFLPALAYQGYVITHYSDPQALKAYVSQPLVDENLSDLIHRSLAADKGQLVSVRSVMTLPVNSTPNQVGEAMKGKTPQGDIAPGMMSFAESYRQQYDRAQKNVSAAKASGVTIVFGTVAGSILDFPGPSAHLELQLLTEAGLSPLEAITAATGNTAKALGTEKNSGVIAKGNWADAILLDADPLADIHNTTKINMVMRHGKFVNRGDMSDY